jgi:hypothetical protein
MKAFLLHRDQDFAVKPELRDAIFGAMMSGDLLAIFNVRRDIERKREPSPVLAPTGNDAVLTQDLELVTLWNAIAASDEFLFEAAKRAVLSPLTDPGAIVYRQQVLADSLEHPEIVRQLYELAVEALDNERKAGGLWFRASPDSILHRSVQVLKLHVGVLKRLRQIADEQAVGFRSEGFTRFFAMLREELADDYLQTVEQHLHTLEFKRGVFESAGLAKGLRGCLNLHDRLAAKRQPVCFPQPLAAGQLALTAEGMYDVCLTLHLESPVVGNEVNADGRSLVMITGANQGGKSTLLRSLGLAQLMMQAGMFAGARSFCAGVCDGLFTHYKREEDVTMESGKLDEELGRMSEITGQITRHSILLCNESFASTNEREGSEIARQVVRAMLHRQIKVFFVTHMYDLAHSFYTQQLGNALFLRAERQPDGRRTFRLVEGEPLPTSYGKDSYQRIFDPAEPAPATTGTRR